MRGAALRACIIRGAEPYRPNQHRSARHPYRSRTIAARCAALILRAPLLIRLRFASDPSGWRPRYHPLRFARIIRYAPRRAARHTRTAPITPVPARRLEITDKARHPAPERLHRLDHTRTGETARNAPEPARSPTARAPSGSACRGARTDRHTRPRQRYAPALRARSRPERTRSHQKPGTRQNQPEALPRARRLVARVVARAPTGIPDRDSVTRQTPPRTRQEPAASAYRTLLRFSTITDPVRIRLRRPGIA